MHNSLCALEPQMTSSLQKDVFEWGNESLENENILKLINSKDKYAKMYRNVEMLDVGWQKVAEELNIGADADTCRKQYYKLLNRYKDIKALPIDNESKGQQFELYHFFEIVYPLHSEEEVPIDFEYLYSNFGEYCRFCLKKKSEELMVREIYDDSSEEAQIISNQLIEKLQFMLNDSKMDFKLSNLICLPCSDKLDYCFEFKKQCEHSSNVLIRVKNEIDSKAQIKPEMLEISIEERQDEENMDNMENEDDTDDFGNFSKDLAYQDIAGESSEESSSEESEDETLVKTAAPKLIKLKKIKIKDGIKKPKVKKQYKGKMHQCSICGILCKGIAMHMLTHSGEKRYKCSYCPKCFTQSGQLKRHINSHLNIRNYKCPDPECDRTFVDPSSVTKHLVVHNKDDRKYHCGLCAARFNRLGALRYHEKTHRQERNHSCDVCNKSFLAKYDLTKHYRIHTGEKPYSCLFCDKRFTISKNAKVHMRVHTKEKPYHCTMCEQAFSYRSSLKNHLVKIHNQTDVPALPLIHAINIAMRETNTNNTNTVDLGSMSNEVHQQSNIHVSNISNSLGPNMPMSTSLLHYDTGIISSNMSINQ